MTDRRLDEAIVGDKDISYKALGLYVWLLNQPDDWAFRYSDIINAATDGETSIRSGLQELVDAGYLTWSRVRAKGRYSHCEYTLFDSDGMFVKWSTGSEEGEYGCVYVLSNEAICGRKIGYTSREAEERASELSDTTAVPMPFDVEYEYWCDNANIVEQMAHRFLSEMRIGESEFFTAGLRTCIVRIEKADAVVNKGVQS